MFFQVLALSLLTVIQGATITYTGGSWTSGSNTVQQANCAIVIPQTTAAGDMTVNFTFTGDITDFDDFGNMNAVSSGSSWRYKTNKWTYGAQTLSYQFHVYWQTSTRPSGTCVISFASSTTSTTSTTASPTTTSTSTLAPTTSSTSSTTSTSTSTVAPTTSTTSQTSTTSSTSSGTTSTSAATTTSSSNASFTTSDYANVLNMSMYFYLAQRSGALPDNRIPYRFDSALGDQGDNGEDLTGGYYDAGDHVKFNFPMASSMTILAYSLYRFESAYDTYNLSDDMRETIKWGLDYFLKCWDSSTSTYYAQVGDGDLDHAYWGRPENMTMSRPAYKVNATKGGSDVAAETAAALAAGYLVFNSTNTSYADTLLDAAESLYAFADTYKAKYSDSIPEVRDFYTSHNGYKDELCLGAGMLYLATNNETYKTKAEAIDMEDSYIWAFSWDDKKALANIIRYDITNNNTYKTPITDMLDRFKYPPSNNDMNFIESILPYRDVWGPLRYAANAAYIAVLAADSGIDATANTAWARSQIDFMLGDNNDDFSYVVGFGSSYPLRPHHRSSSCPDLPSPCNDTARTSSDSNPQILNGALVGGPDSNGNYADDRTDFQESEVACDYNAGFTGTLAGLLHFL